MADDLSTMKARIALELRRSDIDAQIASAINDAIAVYQKERFRFSESVPSAPITFNTVIDQDSYGVGANANIGTLFNIDYLLLTIGTTNFFLDPMNPADLHVYNQQQTMKGQPLWYAYEGNEILLSPIPSGIWPIEIGLFKRVAAPAADDEAGNPWMIDGERLIRARAKYEIAVHVTRNPTMAVAMSPDIPSLNGGTVGAAYREWKSLKGEANRVTSLKRVRAMKF